MTQLSTFQHAKIDKFIAPLASLPNLSSNQKLMIATNDVRNLWLDQMDLTELPALSPDLEHLYCDHNRLTFLPELPKYLTFLDCAVNELTYLSETLPDGITNINVFRNKLIRLPENLPKSLSSLICDENRLVSLPNNLPTGLRDLYCLGNPYLHITKENAKRFSIKETPDYHQIMQNFKEIMFGQMRVRKLRFCARVSDQSDEFRYRPTGSGYLELKQKNKGKYADLKS